MAKAKKEKKLNPNQEARLKTKERLALKGKLLRGEPLEERKNSKKDELAKEERIEPPKDQEQVDVRALIKKRVPWGQREEEESDESSVPEREPTFPGCNPTLMTVSSDTTMRKWDLKNGRCEKVFAGHDASITSMRCDFNSWLAITGSLDNSLALWDLKHGKWLGSMGGPHTGHTGAINDINVNWEGEQAVTASFDHTLRVWDLAEAKCTKILDGHHTPVVCASTDWATGRVASGAADMLAKIWDLETGQCVQNLEGHTGAVWCCDLEPNGGHQLVTGSMDRHIMLWDLRTSKCVKAILRHEGYVTHVNVSWELQEAITCSCDRTIVHWDLVEGEVINRLGTPPGQGEKSDSNDAGMHSGSVWCATVDWKGYRLCTGAGPGDNCVRLWDLADLFCEAEIDGHDGSVWWMEVDWALPHRIKAELDEALRAEISSDEDEDSKDGVKKVKEQQPAAEVERPLAEGAIEAQEEARRSSAATRIQARVRGMLARRRVDCRRDRVEETSKRESGHGPLRFQADMPGRTLGRDAGGGGVA